MGERAGAMWEERRMMMVGEMSMGLEQVMGNMLRDGMVEIRKQGVTVLLDEKDVFSAKHVADRGDVMETGRVVREGTAQQLADDPEVQRAYLGL